MTFEWIISTCKKFLRIFVILKLIRSQPYQPIQCHIGHTVRVIYWTLKTVSWPWNTLDGVTDCLLNMILFEWESFMTFVCFHAIISRNKFINWRNTLNIYSSHSFLIHYFNCRLIEIFKLNWWRHLRNISSAIVLYF